MGRAVGRAVGFMEGLMVVVVHCGTRHAVGQLCRASSLKIVSPTHSSSKAWNCPQSAASSHSTSGVVVVAGSSVGSEVVSAKVVGPEVVGSEVTGTGVGDVVGDEDGKTDGAGDGCCVLGRDVGDADTGASDVTPDPSSSSSSEGAGVGSGEGTRVVDGLLHVSGQISTTSGLHVT